MANIGILLCDDLLFSSRVVGTAKALGLSMHTVKNVADLRVFLEQSTPACVILDLHTLGLDVDEFVRKCSSGSPRPKLIGYGSHVDTATLKAARDAGLDVVWPRSKFMEELATALPGWFRPAESAS
jgi:CheY-like chemotaxis protein